MGPAQGEQRVLRGGSFIFHSSIVRSANRNNNPPDSRLKALGFRVTRIYSAAP